MKSPSRVLASYAPMMWIIALVAVICDQLSKQAVLSTLHPGQILPVIGSWARLTLLFNPGAAFSFGQNMTWVFTCIQLAFAIGILGFIAPRMQEKWPAIGLALVAGGAAGNLIDRLFRAPGFFVGHVVDFISIGSFAVFNIADSCITVGVAIFVIAMLFGKGEDSLFGSGAEKQKNTVKPMTTTGGEGQVS